MNNLKITTQEGHILFTRARATNHPITDDIVLYLPNIMKDINNNIDKLAPAIDRLVIIELICSIYTKENPNKKPFCEGKSECPINKLLRKVDLNHELLLPCNQDLKDADEQVFEENQVDIHVIPSIVS